MPRNAKGIRIIMWLPVIPLTKNVLSDEKRKKKMWVGLGGLNVLTDEKKEEKRRRKKKKKKEDVIGVW